MKTRTNRIRLNESQLNRIIKESVKRILMEDELDAVDMEKQEKGPKYGKTEDRWEDCAFLAQKALRKGNFEEAIRLCKKASQLYDENSMFDTFVPTKSGRVRVTTNYGDNRVNDFLKDPESKWPTVSDDYLKYY